MTKEQKIALIILYTSFINTKIYDLFHLTLILQITKLRFTRLRFNQDYNISKLARFVHFKENTMVFACAKLTTIILGCYDCRLLLCGCQGVGSVHGECSFPVHCTTFPLFSNLKGQQTDVFEHCTHASHLCISMTQHFKNASLDFAFFLFLLTSAGYQYRCPDSIRFQFKRSRFDSRFN